MRPVRLIIASLAVLLCCTSCGRAALRKVHVMAVESVERRAWSGADIALRVDNGMKRDLPLDSCTVEIFSPSGRLLSLELRGGVSVPARKVSTAVLRMKFHAGSPAAIQSLWRRLLSGDTEPVRLRAGFVVRIGDGRSQRIYTRPSSLSEILNIFGVTKEEFSSYFQTQ